MSSTDRQIANLNARLREQEQQLAQFRLASQEKASWVTGVKTDNAAVLFELTATLSANISATATADITVTSDSRYAVDSEITVHNTGEFFGQVGAIGCAILVVMATGPAQWWIVHLQEPAPIKFTFTNSTHVYTAPSPDYKTLTAFSVPQTITYSDLEVIGEYPFNLEPSSPTITNPNNMYAVSGDTGYAMWDAEAGAYVLSQVRNQYARKIVFKLNTNWPTGLDKTQTDATALMPAHDETGPVPTTFTLRDRYNRAHNARASEHASRPADVGVAVFNYATLEYDIIECSHRATFCFGYLDDTFSGTPATFNVVVSSPQDGSDPTNGTTLLTVQNYYSWEKGTVGHNIEVVRDSGSGNWRPRQMRCPN